MARHGDRITRIELGLHGVPPAFAVSDADVVVGRRRDHVELRAD